MFKLYFNTSRKFIEEQLVLGNNVTQNQIIDFKLDELSSEERQILIRHCFIYPLGTVKHFYCGHFKSRKKHSNFSLDISETEFGSRGKVSWINLIYADGTTLKDVIEYYRAFEKQQELDEKDALEKEEQRKKENENREREREIEVAKRKKEKEEYLLEKAVKEKEDKEKKESLRQWAIKNGSEFLKLRIEENFNWLELARQEYALSVLPDGFTINDPAELQNYIEQWDYNNPNVAEMGIIKDIRKKFPQANLRRYKYVTDIGGEYYDENDRIWHVNYIEFELEVLDGSDMWVYFQL